MPTQDLNGRVVAITGGARGIGLATARACVAAGMRVAIGDIDGAFTEEVARGLGPDVVGLRVDVSDPESFAGFLDETEQLLGPLDVLINNAGIFVGGMYAEQDPVAIERLLAVNVGGVFTGTRLALDRFGARGEGHIVNVASSGGLFAAPGAATYCGTKHLVVGFTRSLRREMHGNGVRTTIVCPGHIKTQMTSGFSKVRGFRMLEPEQVANAIVAALRSGREEVIIPGELGVATRLLALLPVRWGDAVTRAGGADKFILGGDKGAQAAYEKSVSHAGTDAR